MAGLSRRQLLVGGAVTAGLVIGWSVWPREYASPLAPGKGEEVFGAYLKIGSDGAITVAVPQCEMGQGVTTVLPQVIAQELGADWRTIAVQAAPLSSLYANAVLAGKWQSILWMDSLPAMVGATGWSARRHAPEEMFQVTADGTMLANYELPAREAAALARSLLCKAAARQWDVSWEACSTADGFVLYEDKRLRFAGLVEAAREEIPPSPLPIQPTPPREQVIPQSLGGNIEIAYPRLDLPSKVDGTANFAGDVRLPDMVYASIRRGPPGDSTLKSFDRNAADDIVGLIDIVEAERWLAAVAGSWWSANNALEKMRPVFVTHGTLADSDSIDGALAAAISEGTGYRLHKVGDPDPVLAGAKRFVAEYTTLPVLHGTIETTTATARFSGGTLELWIGTQSPQAAREKAAEAIGISTRDVVVYPMMAGGAFDRRLDNEIAAQVAVLARDVRRPVQLIWSRGEEAIQDLPLAPTRAHLSAVTDAAGAPAAMASRVAVPATAREFGLRLSHSTEAYEAQRAVRGDYDALAVEGCIPPYAVPGFSLDHHPADIAVATGRLRGNSHIYGCFFTETFVDELAHRAAREPLSYRIQMLGEAPRLARCLTGVAALAEWDGGLDNSGQGVACHAMQGGAIAVVATARRAQSGLRVDTLTAVVDIGRIVNIDIARQQIEGGLVFGLSLAIGSATGHAGGLAEARRLGDLNLPLLADTPEIIVELVDSEEEPTDPGEIGVPAVAPAIGNALFSATGLRLRNLPLLTGGL